MLKKSVKIGFFSLFFIAAFILPSMAANEISATRSISDKQVSAGGTFEVTLTMDLYDTLSGPALTESLPTGWEIIDTSNNNDLTYSSIHKSWLNVGQGKPGDKFTVNYKVKVPADAETGVYDITGNASARKSDGGTSSIRLIEKIQGNSQITVAQNGGTNPNDTGTKPNDTGTKPNDTGTNPNDTGTKPNDNGTNPNDNGTNPNNNKPVDTGNTTTSTSALASGVCLKANITSSVCIEVSPDCVDFGTLSAGQISGNHQITIKNKGGKNAHMTAEVMDIAKNLYVDGLKLNSQTWKSFNTDVSSGQSSNVDVKLAVPSDYIGIGSMNGKVVFWAEMK